MEKESGEGMGRGGRKLKAEPKQKVWKEGMELGKAGAQRGGGLQGSDVGIPTTANKVLWGSARVVLREMGKGSCSPSPPGMGPTAAAWGFGGPRGPQRGPHPLSIVPLPLGKRQQLRPETGLGSCLTGPAWEKAGPQMGFD